jgi:hypothetical protein
MVNLRAGSLAMRRYNALIKPIRLAQSKRRGQHDVFTAGFDNALDTGIDRCNGLRLRHIRGLRDTSAILLRLLALVRFHVHLMHALRYDRQAGEDFHG